MARKSTNDGWPRFKLGPAQLSRSRNALWYSTFEVANAYHVFVAKNLSAPDDELSGFQHLHVESLRNHKKNYL